MILIFDLFGGLTDMIKDLISIIKFANSHKLFFTIRNATSRQIDNPLLHSDYEIKELLDEISLHSLSQYYLIYDSILDKINNENTYDFYDDKIKDNIWNENKRNILNNEYSQIITNCNKEYIIIGGAFWWYSNLVENIEDRIEIIKKIKPSCKIYSEYLKNTTELPELYNLIHYRYEEDWIPNLKQANIPYIVPPIDELMKYIPFKNNYPVYICCSMMETLHDKKLLYDTLDKYPNILKKKENNLNFDENGFLDLLLASNAQEVFGNSISGFSISINEIKKTKNYYNEMEVFSKYNKIACETGDGDEIINLDGI